LLISWFHFLDFIIVEYYQVLIEASTLLKSFKTSDRIFQKVALVSTSALTVNECEE